jgi:galactokinase
MEMDEGAKKPATPYFVRPFLYALNRMQANEILRPTQYIERAKILLVDRLGVVGPIPECAFSHAVVGVMADHTHYFDGFALVLRLRQGIAVALRANDLDHHRIVLEGYAELLSDEESPTDDGGISNLFHQILKELGFDPSLCFDVSMVGSIPTGLGAAFQGALTVSLVRALHALRAKEVSDADIRTQSLSALNRWCGQRFSPAYVIGPLAEQSEPFILIDTSTMSHLPIDVPPGSKLGWGVIEWSKDWMVSYKGAGKRKAQAEKALKDLQKQAFPNLVSFRNLEHRDLEQALEAVPRRSRSALRFLVTENRNVQKMIVAIKKGDWQFFGALMMISEASKSHDWSTTDSIHDLITEEAEKAALDGIFGVVQTGEGGCMLVFGQPFSLPAFLDRMRDLASTHTSEEVETFII